MNRRTPRFVPLAFSMATALALSGCSGGSSNTQPDPGVFNSVIDLDFAEGTVRHADDDSFVKAVSGPDDSGEIRVVYVIDGVEHEVHFTEDDYDAEAKEYVKRHNPVFTVSHNELWAVATFDYFRVYEWWVCTHSMEELDACAPSASGHRRARRGYVVDGEQTAVLPQGTADYEGSSHLEGYSIQDSVFTKLQDLRSKMTLKADFNSRTVSGSLHDFEHRRLGTFGDYEKLGDVVVNIENGRITDDGISAELSGTHEAVPGEGEMFGHFFGPAAAEVGGVLESNRDGTGGNAVYHGWFGGRKQ